MKKGNCLMKNKKTKINNDNNTDSSVYGASLHWIFQCVLQKRTHSVDVLNPILLRAFLSSSSSFICGISALLSKKMKWNNKNTVAVTMNVMDKSTFYFTVLCIIDFVASKVVLLETNIVNKSVYFINMCFIKHTFLGWFMFSRMCLSSWYLQM